MVRLYEEADKIKYEKFVTAHKNGSFLQSSFWGQIKKEWENVILISENENGEIKGAVSLLIRRMPIPVFKVTVAYAPRGPVCDYNDYETFNELISAAKAEAKKRGACLLKFDPDKSYLDSELISAAKAHGLKIKVHGLAYENMQPICNHKINLSEFENEEDIIKKLNYKTRNQIRSGEKRGAVVVNGSEKDIPEFYEIIKETEARKNIALRNEEYYYKMLKEIPSEHLVFLLAKAEDKVIAGAIFIIYGKTVTYSYSAMANGVSKYNANYVIQHEILKEGVRRGCEIYDMGGVDGNNLSEGVAVFKKNFGGEVIRNIGELDLVMKPFEYFLFNFSIGTGRKILKLIKRKK